MTYCTHQIFLSFPNRKQGWYPGRAWACGKEQKNWGCWGEKLYIGISWVHLRVVFPKSSRCRGEREGERTWKEEKGKTCRIKPLKERSLQLQYFLLKITSHKCLKTPFKVKSFNLSTANISNVAFLEKRQENTSFSYWLAKCCSSQHTTQQCSVPILFPLFSTFPWRDLH